MIKQAYEIVEEAIPGCDGFIKATAVSFILGRMGQKDTMDAMTLFTNRFQNILDPKQKIEDTEVKSPPWVKEILDKDNKKGKKK